MKSPISLTELFVTKVDITNDRNLARSKSGILITDASAAYGDIEEGENGMCAVYHNLMLNMRGVSEGVDDTLFTVRIEATGKFMASLEDVESARTNLDTQTCVSSMIADLMFLGMRSYLDQSFSMMGLKNVQIPWGFKLEQPATLKSK
jgi:hypothetical protein